MNQREASKKDWSSTNTVVDINSGSLQRIADACEKMATNVVYLQDRYAKVGAENLKLQRSNIQLRARLKKCK